jgi:helicase
LLDQDATAENIRSAISDLQNADADDSVVISFSGHGTEDHRLVPVDADTADIAGSCISLNELARLLDGIKSKNLIVALDCCFAGGFGGARVFSDHSTRAMTEDRSTLEALVRGEGRVVLTASGAGEPALETMAYRHGLLTYWLADGLQGAEDLASSAYVSLLPLLHYVMRKVQADAKSMHAVQTPTMYGSIEGAPAVAQLVPGQRFAAAFPDRSRPPATRDWNSLLAYDLPQSILEVWKEQMPDGLNTLQLEAINKYGVLDAKPLLVVAPTGAGKTMIGEVTAMQAVGHGARAVMLLPLRALVNDKYEYMRRAYGDALSVIRASGEHSDQMSQLMTGQYDVALLTYEKFLNIALGNPHILRALSVVIVDEVQILSDETRGAGLEFLLTLLRSGHGRVGAPQIVALSAVIGDTNGLERWLYGGLLRSEVRPIPLRERVLDAHGSLRTFEPDGTESFEERAIQPVFATGSQSSKPWVIPLVRQLIDDGKKVIVFRATKGDTVGAAGYLANALGLPPADDVIAALPVADLSASSDDLRRVLQGGVGFHNSDLDRNERLALEAAFRDPTSPLKVLVATTTLAMGINTPAEAVVIAGLKHPPATPYSVAEYKNMAGRAGRPGITSAGESYIIATSDINPSVAWSTYIRGHPEPITSHFLSDTTDPQTLIVRSLLALGGSVDQNALVDLLDNSFAMWQQVDGGYSTGWDVTSLSQDLLTLRDTQLIDLEPNGILTLTALGRYAAESGIEVRSVAQVASALRFAPQELSVECLVTIAQVTTELDDLYLPRNKRSHQEQRRWPGVLAAFGVPHALQSLHMGGGDPLLRAKRAAACLLFMSPEPLAQIEQNLMQHTIGNSVAGPLRGVASRTRDVIGAVAQVAQFYGNDLGDDQEIEDLALRLEVGLPREVMEIARKLGTTISRGDYLKLRQAGLLTLDGISTVDEKILRSLVEPDVAKSLKAAVATDR